MIGNKYSKEENLISFNLYFDKIINEIDADTVIVTDADETLSTKDTSRIFWENNFSEEYWHEFQSDFVSIGRNFDGFLNAANIYSKIDVNKYIKFCENSAKLVELRHGWIEFIQSAKAVIIVTSGLRLLWENVIKLNKWNHVYLVGGNHFDLDNFIVDPDIKLEIVKKIHNVDKKVIAFGDSRVDAPMLLCADIGVAVANERQSPGLAECLLTSNSVYQLEMEEKILPGIPIESLDNIVNCYLKYNKK